MSSTASSVAGEPDAAIARQRWLSQNLVCTKCARSGLVAGEAAWTCKACGETFPIINKAISFIDAELAAATKVNVDNNVSSHPYNPAARNMIAAVEKSGGMAVDCGAGSRDFRSDNLIQVEITPYDNIDVLAVNQKLPFADASLDLVISMDVLEHVSDPVASAREIARVLKPGGVLFLDLPFLQTEHGYPHHYHGFTRMGVRQLFEGLLDCEAHYVPRAGHPSVVVRQILHTFLWGLPKSERARFEAMTIGEIIHAHPLLLHDSFPTLGAEAGKADIVWKMAGCTQAAFTKPGANGNLLGLDLASLEKGRPSDISDQSKA